MREIYAVFGLLSLEHHLQSDGVTHLHHHTPCAPAAPQPTNQLNNVVPAQPYGTVTATINDPPVFVRLLSIIILPRSKRPV